MGLTTTFAFSGSIVHGRRSGLERSVVSGKVAHASVFSQKSFDGFAFRKWFAELDFQPHLPICNDVAQGNLQAGSEVSARRPFRTNQQLDNDPSTPTSLRSKDHRPLHVNSANRTSEVCTSLLISRSSRHSDYDA